jgi:hypothetical protein
MTAVFPFKENNVSQFPIGDPHDLDIFLIVSGYGNRSSDHAILSQRHQPRDFRSERIFRLISRPLETQSPVSPGRSYHLVRLILRNVDQVNV